MILRKDQAFVQVRTVVACRSLQPVLRHSTPAAVVLQSGMFLYDRLVIVVPKKPGHAYEYL